MSTPTAHRIAGTTPGPSGQGGQVGGRMPNGVRMSTVWATPTGTLLRGRVELPVDKDWRPVGWLWLCQQPDCPTVVWWFDEHSKPEQEFCTRHPLQLVPAAVDTTSPDPIVAARTETTHKLRDLYVAKRRKMVEAAQAKADQIRAEAATQARRTTREVRGHVPSVAVSVAALAAGVGVSATLPAWQTFTAGAATASIGVLVAYCVTYVVCRWLAVRDGTDPADLVGKVGRQVRAQARHIAAGVLAWGLWLATAAFTGVDPGTWPGSAALLGGVALAWAVNRQHWDLLWERRRRLAELARRKAEEVAVRMEKEAAAPAPAPLVDDNDPAVVGARMAAIWARIAQDPTVPFAGMARTRIVADQTRPLEVPGADGALVRVGWEFAVDADPGILVATARNGGESPLLAATFRSWLGSMLDRDASTVSTAHVQGKPNRGVLILSDGLPLGDTVPWKGPAGIRRAKGGAIYGHMGRALTGEDVEEALYVPGQPMGGLTVGTSGGGKSRTQILRFLNLLAAGIFPMLHDPKSFLDYIDFVGVFPMVALPEHRDVMLDTLWLERERRQRLMTTQPRQDRHKRRRTGDPEWDVRNGPPIRAAFDEFHMNARDQKFIDLTTTQVRTERAIAIGVDALSQGGGLADFADSVLRGLLADIRLDLYRVSDHLARLAGYQGDYSPSQLPRLPGMMLSVTPDAPPVPLRAAFVTRDDVDGSVYDWLYHPDGSPNLQAPQLPAETLAVFDQTGLAELWRWGREPGGVDRLLSATNGPDLSPGEASPPAAVQVAGRVKAADVILAVLHATGGVELATHIAAHPVWATLPGWGGSPSLSTVTRPLNELKKAGRVFEDPASGRLTLSGSAVEQGRVLADQFGLTAAAASGVPVQGVLPLGAVAERDAELRAEARTVADAANS